jgi:SAM-dependent methyltransferase
MAESLARIGYNLQAADIHPELCTYKEALSFAIMKADANAASLPIESELFDLVVMTEVFEHLYLNPIVTMREIMRILRPGGFLYLTTPNGLGLRKLVKVARKGRFQDIYQQWKNLEETGLMGHVHEYSPREVGEFIKDCGYADVTTKTANVYRKGVVENLFWRAMTTPLISMRENIICIARKPL